MHAGFRRRAYTRHAHDDAVVIGWVESGTQHSSYGRGAYVARAGDVVVIGPAIMHDGHPDRSGGFVYHSLHVSLAALRDCAEAETAFREEDLCLRDPVVADQDLRDRLRAVCRRAGGPVSGAAEREALLLGLVAALAACGGRGGAMEGARGRGDRRLARMARDHMLACLSEDALSVARIAAACGSTRSYLTRVFHEAYGLPPHAYLTLARVSAAKRRLIAGEAAADVAAAVGFVDQSHLIRQFRAVFGVTPGQFTRAR